MPASCKRHALCAACAVVWLFACDATLYESLPHAEAERAADRLAAIGISAKLVPARSADARQRYRVEVPTAAVARAIAALEHRAADAMPAQPGFAEIYGDVGLVPTPGEERARAAAAAGGEIARTLQRLAVVEAARVHVSPTAPGSQLDAPASPATALAWVRLAADTPADALSEAAVAEIVAAAVPGLDAASVVVRLEVAPRTPPPSPPTLVQIGPLSVAAGSVPALKAILGASVAVNGALAAALALLWRRQRRQG